MWIERLTYLCIHITLFCPVLPPGFTLSVVPKSGNGVPTLERLFLLPGDWWLFPRLDVWSQGCVQCAPVGLPGFCFRQQESEAGRQRAFMRKSSGDVWKGWEKGKGVQKALQQWRHHARILKSEEWIHLFTQSSIHSFTYSFNHSLIHPFMNSLTQSSIHSLNHPFTHLSIHSCIHPLIHSVAQSFNHPFIHSIHSLIYPFLHAFIHSLTHSLNHPFIHSIIHSLIYPFTHSSTHSFIPLLIHSFIHLFIYSVTHSFLHSLTHSIIHASSSIHSFSHPFIRWCSQRLNKVTLTPRDVCLRRE